MTYSWREERVLNPNLPRTAILAPEKLVLNDIMTLLFEVENKTLLFEHEFTKTGVREFFKELFQQLRNRQYSLESLRVNDVPRQIWQYGQHKLKRSPGLDRIALTVSTSDQNQNSRSKKFNLSSIPNVGPLYLIAKITRGVTHFCKEAVFAFRFAVTEEPRPTLTSSPRSYEILDDFVSERSNTPLEYDNNEDSEFLEDL